MQGNSLDAGSLRRASLVLLLLVLPFRSPGEQHPFLFLTPRDADRVRTAARRDPDFARFAAELRDRALTNRIEDLPPLDREWWAEAKSKPWAQIYPEVFHHTWIAPQKWASLAQTCARAHLLQPSAELKAKARRILMVLSTYTFEYEHFDVGMNYTIWSLQALDAYDILHNEMPPEERQQMDACFMRLLAAVEKNDDYWVKYEPGGKLNNHYAWHKLCFCMIGAFYSRPELIRRGLEGPKGVHFMLEHGFRDDGLWLEGSIPYQFAATSALLQIAEILENSGSGQSLYFFETGDGRSLAQAYRALEPLLWPDRTLPTIGDCYARRPHLGTHADFEILARRLENHPFGWLLADVKPRSSAALFVGMPKPPSSGPPPQHSRVWPEMGYVALRSLEGEGYWSGKGWSVFGTWSNRPVHEHADKLSLMLFGEGHLWLPDLEARSSAEHAFSSLVQSQLNRATVCHNTVMIGGQNQRLPSQPLDLVEFSSLPNVKRASFGDLRGQLYPGVRQLRTVIVRQEYVLDFFQVQAGEGVEVSWLTHVDGVPEIGPSVSGEAARLPEGPAWSWLKEPRSTKTQGHYSEVFSKPEEHAGADRFRLDLWSDGPLEVVTCGFPTEDAPGSAAVPMRMVRCHRAAPWFLAIYRSGRGELPEITATVQAAELNTWSIQVRKARHVVPRL